MKREYRTEKAWGEYDINNIIQSMEGWRPIFITPVVRNIHSDSKWLTEVQFLITFEREIDEKTT